MDSDNINENALRKKAEDLVQTQFNRVKDKSKDINELLYELRVHQVELEMQNEELRLAQQKLEYLHRKYFDLYNFAPVGYFTLDKDGLILEVNLTGAALLNSERSNLTKKAFVQFIALEHRNKFHHHLIDVLKNEIKQNIDLKLLKMDSDSFCSNLETLIVQDKSGDFKEFRLAVTDITDIKNATKEVELASKYNRSLIEASLDPLVTIGSDGKITDVNRSTENVTGFTRDELIGTDFSNYFTNAKMARKGYQQVFKEGFVLDYPLEIKHKNGHITPVLYNASVYKDDLGKVLGVFAAARDITEIQKAEDILVNYHDNLEERVKIRTKELAESNEDLKRFAYITSHDLREPLRMITNFLQLLERRYKDKLDQDAIDFINFAVDGAKRLDDMINDLLEYSRLTRIDLHFTQVNSEKALEETLIILKVLIEENNAVVTYDPLPNIIGDEILFIQLFQNLINNAIKYRSQETPQIHISAKKENNQYLFSVKDNGIGIDSKHLDRIFTIFQRLHGKDEYEGTGIGLAIAEYIVHKFGGVIWVESELGKGSTFYFTIPIKS